MERLTRIANKYETDKGTKFEDSHGYTEFYQRFFEKYENPKIIEIGTWHGDSVKMLNDFFDGDCEIWACDWNVELAGYVEGMPNVHFVHMDAGSKESIEKFRKSVEDIGFDIIIDDASHLWPHQMNLISGLHTLLNDNGIYIIEDIHFSRLYDDDENSPLFFITFLNRPNIMLTEKENRELLGKIKDVQIFSRKNHAFEMDKNWGGRSMTSVITFEK